MSKRRGKPAISTERPRDTAFVLHPASWLARKTQAEAGLTYLRDQALKLEEATGLALAIKLEVVHAETFDLPKINPGTFIGKGRVDAIGLLVEKLEPAVIVMDCALSPIQQRNLERAWNVKVIDRTGLILEIFGERARTREGTLQVDLAHLTYQKGRLVRTWTHLERQRGGVGFMGGPGERQIESDRRQIQEKITRIKKDLEAVGKRRTLHRKARQEVPYPIVALAGYTNAGKSTLFNRLTGAAVDAEDKLFATLDPTLRAITLPGGRKVILSDTVGFISDLPTELVAAFRATLEEVREADLILHVRDASNPEADAQKQDVLDVLASLGIKDDVPILECLNKVDLLEKVEAESVQNIARRHKDMLVISALTGRGLKPLLKRIEGLFGAQEPEVGITVEEGDGEVQAWLHSHARILGQKKSPGTITFRARLPEKAVGQFKKRFPGYQVKKKQAGVKARQKLTA